MTSPYPNHPRLADPDGFRIEIDADHERGDIVLSRPPMNVIEMGQRDQLRAAFEALDGDGRVRVIVLRAEGEHFSSGGYIRGFLEASPEHVSHLADNVAAPWRCAKPVIAANQGYCFGVGFELSLACDFRIATTGTRYALPEQRLGQIPGSGGSARLQAIVGIQRTKDVVMRSRRISGEEALAWGLVVECVANDGLAAATAALVDELRAFSPLAQRTAKKLINDSENATVADRHRAGGQCLFAAAPVRRLRRGRRRLPREAQPRVPRPLRNDTRTSDHLDGGKTMKPTMTHVAAAALLAALGVPALAQDGPIKVGVDTPLSGTYAGIGQQVRWGLELAQKEINAGGGITGRQVELVFEDSEANPAVAVQKAEKLFQVENVDFLTGTVNSGATLAVGQVAERAGKLLATTVSFSDAITGDKCSPNVFRVNARAGQQSAALAAWLKEKHPDAKVFYLGPDYEMGRSTVAAFKENAEGVGATSTGEVFAPLDAKDYSQYFGSLRAAQPNVLYTSVAGNDTVRLFTQMNDFGVREGLTVLGASGTVTSQNIGAIGDAAEGFVTGVGYSPQIDSPENEAFVTAFRDAYDADPDLYGADSYGLLFAYKAAVEKAGSTETDAVRAALEDLTWATPQGEKTIRAGDHQAMQPMYVVEVKDGKFEIISSVPPEDAIGADVCERF